MKHTAIVLAGGRGSRMNSKIKKQYLTIGGKPVIYYSLQVFQQHSEIDEIILVCSESDQEYCWQEIVNKYQFSKVKKIVPGGRERYLSVYEGLKQADDSDYVLIHDSARPFLTEDIISQVICALPIYQACVVGVPVKDTIKLSRDGYIDTTVPREKLWATQTPQAFSYELIRKAYEKVLNEGTGDVVITDDAMITEYTGAAKVKLIEGSYYNIKITTPEDILIAEGILSSDSYKNIKKL